MVFNFARQVTALFMVMLRRAHLLPRLSLGKSLNGFSSLLFSLAADLSKKLVLFIGLLYVMGCQPGVTPKLRPKPANEAEKVVEKREGRNAIQFPQIDILFVIDNSRSMDEVQANLKKNATVFTEALESTRLLDYRVGITTSDSDPKGLITVGPYEFASSSNKQSLRSLAQAMVVGTGGDSTEYFFPQILPIVANQEVDFVRPGAHLALFFVTDTDDQSTMRSSHLFDEISILKNHETEKILAYGAIIPKNREADCPRATSEQPPLKILQFLQIVSESEWDKNHFTLCDDFGASLAAVGQDIAEKVGSDVLLTQIPDPKTIEVTYGGMRIPNDFLKGWTYDPHNNSLYFGREIEWPEGEENPQLDIFFERALFPEERRYEKK